MKESSLNKDSLESADGLSNHDLLELFVSGIVLARKNSRSILLLEDKSGKSVMPVWLAAGEDHVVKDQVTARNEGGVSHKSAQKILSHFDIQVKDCTFTDLTGHYQNVFVTFARAGKLEGVRLRADEAMSFCIFHGARFWSTKELIEKCRDQQIELESALGHMYGTSLFVEKEQKYLM